MGTQRWRGRRAGGGPSPLPRSPSGTGFFGEAPPPSRNPRWRWGWDPPGVMPARCIGDGGPGPTGTGWVAEPRGAALPAPTAARWPSPLPRGPARHEAPGSRSVPVPSLLPREQPSLKPKSHRGRRGDAGASTPPAVERDVAHATRGRIWPTSPRCLAVRRSRSGPVDPQLPRSPTVGWGMPWHARSPGDPPPRSLPHVPCTRHPPAACPAAPAPQRGQGDGCGGHGSAGEDGGDGASGEVEVSPSALFYQL